MQDFSFYPTKGFIPNGGLFKTNALVESVKVAMDKMYVESVNRFGSSNFPNYGACCKNNGDPAEKDIESVTARCFMTAMYLNSHATTLEYKAAEAGEERDTWAPKGNMSEAAIIVACAKMRIGITNPDDA